MGCRSIHKKLPQYVQGLLSVADARFIDDHVRACSACRAELADLKKIWDDLDALPEPDAAASMATQVLRRIDDYEKRHEGALRAWLLPFKPSFASAIAVIMIAGLLSGAFISSVYYPDKSKTQTDDDSVYTDMLSDVPPASFLDLYLQTAGQNSEENSL